MQRLLSKQSDCPVSLSLGSGVLFGHLASSTGPGPVAPLPETKVQFQFLSHVS